MTPCLESLHLALEHDLALAKKILSDNPGMCDARVTRYGETLLQWFVTESNTDAIELLLNIGANADLPSDHGDTPLLLAIMIENADIVRILLENGANPNLGIESLGIMPIFEAVRRGSYTIIELLCKHGAVINYETADGWFESIEEALEQTKGDRGTIESILNRHRYSTN